MTTTESPQGQPVPTEPIDTTQIDNDVADLLTTIVGNKVQEWYGSRDYCDEIATEIIAQLKHDLAALGYEIRERRGK